MTGAEVTSMVFSSVALVLAIISLAWQIARARADRPQLDITGWNGYTVDNEDWAHASWGFTITITNVGREPVTIDGVSWRIYDAQGNSFTNTSSEIANTMPVRLEGNDSRTWTFATPVRGTPWEGLKGCATAEYVKRPALWGRWRKQPSRRRLNGALQSFHVPPEVRERAAKTA